MAKTKSMKKVDELAIARKEARELVKQVLQQQGLPVWDNAVNGKLEGMTLDTLIIPRQFNGLDIQIKFITPAKKDGNIQYYLDDEDVESLDN